MHDRIKWPYDDTLCTKIDEDVYYFTSLFAVSVFLIILIKNIICSSIVDLKKYKLIISQRVEGKWQMCDSKTRTQEMKLWRNMIF